MTPDRYGNPQEAELPVHDPRCKKGWLDRDADRPVPCLVCKPHLAPDRRQRDLGQ